MKQGYSLAVAVKMALQLDEKLPKYLVRPVDATPEWEHQAREEWLAKWPEGRLKDIGARWLKDSMVQGQLRQLPSDAKVRLAGMTGWAVEDLETLAKTTRSDKIRLECLKLILASGGVPPGSKPEATVSDLRDRMRKKAALSMAADAKGSDEPR